MGTTLKQSNFWLGLILGAVISRTLDAIPDKWWWFTLLWVALMLPTIAIKDKITAKMRRMRDEDKARNELEAWERLVVHSGWEFVDFLIGAVLLGIAWAVLLVIYLLIANWPY